MKMLAEYLNVNLWIFVIWVMLLTHDGTFVPYLGIVLMYSGLVGIANLPTIEKYLFGAGSRNDQCE
jgi:hypothetical protein